MAACGFGIPGLKFANYDSDGARSRQSRLGNGLRVVQFDASRLSHGSHRVITACKVSSIEADPAAAANLEDSSNETMLPDDSDQTSTFVPNSSEVESLLTVLCETSSIAEFELKLGKFQLRVTRNLAEQSPPPPPPQPPSPARVTSHSTEATPDSNGSASFTSLALTKPEASSGGVQSLLNTAADEGLAILQSPRVGYFRRSRTIKGKRAPPSCKEKDVVKEGQVLCYIEQLGGEVPVESDVSGEVVKILREDGDPVGYGDALIAVLPSFPGIMKLQ